MAWIDWIEVSERAGLDSEDSRQRALVDFVLCLPVVSIGGRQ
jgi:hypothetical protein